MVSVIPGMISCAFDIDFLIELLQPLFQLNEFYLYLKSN